MLATAGTGHATFKYITNGRNERARLIPKVRSQACTPTSDVVEVEATQQSIPYPRQDDVLNAQIWIRNWREAQKLSQFELWKRCIKPPMYSVALVPVATASAMAYYATGLFMAKTCGDLMLGGVLVIAWLNLSNDAFDSTTGVDSSERKPESIINLTGASWQAVTAVSLACLALGCRLLSGPLSATLSSVPVYLLASAIICGYVYQGPPFRLSYKGVGEPLCFLAFGPLATTAFFLCLAMPALPGSTVTSLLQANMLEVVIASTVVGLTTTSVLFCSHFHQIRGDKAAGKLSPLVRLGTRRATQVLQIGLLVTHALALCLGLAHPELQTLAPLGILAMPAAFSLANFAGENHANVVVIKILKRYAIKWHCAFGAALFLIFFVAGVGIHGADSLA